LVYPHLLPLTLHDALPIWKPRVSSFSVRFIEITSDRASNSSSSTSGAPGRGDRFQAITSMPRPRPMRRTSLPIPPRPITPSLLRSEEHTSELQSRVDLVCR